MNIPDQFEGFLGHAPIGAYLVDADFRIVAVNSAALPAFGNLPGGPVGRDLSEVIHLIWEKNFADHAEAIFRNTLATGESYFSREHAQVRVDRAATEYYEWSAHGTPMPGGRPGLIVYFLDVEEYRRAQQSAHLLASIVESSEDAIISKNLDARIVSWNRGAERIFGYTEEEVVGQSIEILIPPDRLQEEPRILARMKKGERVEHFETIRVRKDGTHIHVSLTISPVRDTYGNIVGASKVARDVTERVRQEKALQETNAALERANADLEHFAWSASHDLQEPLRMVALYSEMLKRKFGGQLGPLGDEYISYTILGASRMERLLRDLRTYTHVTTIGQEPEEDIDTEEILKRTLQNLDVAIQDSGASITSTPLPKVRMYEFQMEQIFQNLIGNAIRYRGDAPPQIRVAAERRGDEWLFSVQDNGIGIEPRFREQIFGIFKRLHSQTESVGTGMGLAICKRAIERSRGRIWVESEPGKGSTFYFTVPVTVRPA